MIGIITAFAVIITSEILLPSKYSRIFVGFSLLHDSLTCWFFFQNRFVQGANFMFSRCLIYKVHSASRNSFILPQPNRFVKNFFRFISMSFLPFRLAAWLVYHTVSPLSRTFFTFPCVVLDNPLYQGSLQTGFSSAQILYALPIVLSSTFFKFPDFLFHPPSLVCFPPFSPVCCIFFRFSRPCTVILSLP